MMAAGCNSGGVSQPSASQRFVQQQSALSGAGTRATAAGEPYDFYLLNLSWSPEFCATHASSEECSEHLGFVVHGLWPQRNDGSYPQHCASRPGPASASDWQGLMPTASLAAHEWETHGTCTPYDAGTYFGLVRKAFGEVKIPAEFATPGAQPKMEPPQVMVDAFFRMNPEFPAGSIAVSCGNNYLTAIEACFDKNLKPIACEGVRSCRANNVKIAPLQ
jgi:ribonuclease T2